MDAKMKGRRPKGAGRWRETTFKGERVLVSPDGAEIYRGTSAEVLSLGFSPHRRRALANALWIARKLRDGESAEDFADECRALRREMIKYHFCGDLHGSAFEHDGEIIAGACARWWGMSADEFDVLSVAAGIEGTLAECGALCGFSLKWPQRLPMTRHEHRALKMGLAAWLAEYNRRNVWPGPVQGLSLIHI